MLRPVLALLMLTTPAQAESALAAVAANFAGVAEILATRFNADTGHEVALTTGSTGKLYAQIGQGAPFDLLLSADADIPARLQAEGHGTAFTYAYGTLTLWAPKGQATDPKELLLDAATLNIAIANPDLAPYGAAAKTALEGMGIYDQLTPKIVMGQNIGQTFALVDTGAASAGFVAKSAIPANSAGYVWDVSPDLYPAIRQDAILLQHGADNAAAAGFLDYLQSDAARAIIADYGYGLP